MRTTWNGSLSFGLVSIPVGLAPATKPAARASDVSFRLLHRECGTPIKQKRFCPTHDRELGPDEIVKGWEVAKGQFVLVEEAELEALTQHDDSRSIEITRFVDAAQVDPIFFDRTYFLVPAQAAAARRPYVLLLNAMSESGMAALGRFVPAGQGEVLPDPPEGRRARARDALRRRRRLLAGRDRGGGRGDRDQEARARAGAPGDLEPHGRLRAGRAPERVPRATCARCSRRSSRARCSRRPEPERPRRR